MSAATHAVLPHVTNTAVRRTSTVKNVGSAEWYEAMVNLAALEPGELVSIKVIITPEFAQWILNNRNNSPPEFINRTLSDQHADNWAKRIENDAYRFSSQGISVCAEGYLNNGQHRLAGIVRSGKSLPVYMTFGEDRDAFAILDATRVRSRRDVLGQMNKQNVNTLSAGAGLLSNIENGSAVGAQPLLNEDLESFLAAHPLLDTIVEKALPLKRMGMSSAAAVAAIHVIWTGTKHSTAKLIDFLRQIEEGGVRETKHPIKIFRELMLSKKLDNHVRAGGYKAPVQAAAMVLAWNLWIRGFKCEPAKLRWQPKEELKEAEAKRDLKKYPFPRPE